MIIKCRTCQIDKDISEFAIRKNNKLRRECKKCLNQISLSNYHKRKLKPKIKIEHKTCIKCNQIKINTEFRKHPSNIDGLHSSCKLCQSKYYQSDTIQKYLKNQKESGKQKEILNRYRNKERDNINARSRERRAYSQKLLRTANRQTHAHNKNKAFKIMGGKCVFCGINDYEILCIDHTLNDGAEERKTYAGNFRTIIKKVIKNDNWQGKYQLSCFNCNRKKQILELRKKNKNDRPEITEEKTCTQCKKTLSLGFFAWTKDRQKGVPFCKDCGCKYNLKRKQKAILKLGNKCNCCGETDLDVLEIDHINEDGAERRKSGKDLYIYGKLITNKRPTNGLQVLCSNCNAKKWFKKLSKKINKNNNTNNSVKKPKTSELIYFNMEKTEFKQITQTIAKEFLNSYHYANFGRSAQIIYGVFLEEKLIAVMKMASVIRKEVATSLGFPPQEVLELDRLCIKPEYQIKNLASYIISKLIKFVYNDFQNVKMIVSFADTAQGHRGTIYKASNWIEVGLTNKSYIYMDKKGNSINKKTLYGRADRLGMTEKEYVTMNSYAKIILPPKMKFIYKLRN